MTVFAQLAVVLGLAALGGVTMRFLKQPLLLGYILVGVIISASGLMPERQVIDWMGQLGVTLLLFLVGLELPVSQLKQMGKVALAGGLGQIIVTVAVGYPLLRLLGFDSLGSIYMAVALAFSSTIIVVKLLTEKGDLHSLWGKITVGMLLIQDFVAIGFLIILSGNTSGGVDWFGLAWVLAKGTVLVATALWLSDQVLPKVLGWLGESTEMLFIAAMAWCVVVAAFVSSKGVGFSVEIGGFLAGLALSGAAQHLQIGARVRPLRDFFLTLFFVSLGTAVTIGSILQLWLPVLVLSLAVLVGRPVIVMMTLGFLGYTKRTSFFTGLSLAQISEFSIILMAAAVRVGQASQSELSLMAIVGALTMVISAYLATHANSLYQKCSKWLNIFELRKTTVSTVPPEEKLTNHILLFGHNRMGSVIYPALQKLGGEVVVVDFDPRTVDALTEEGKRFVFGDLADVDLYDDLGVDEAKLIVSTVVDLEDNLQLLQYLKQKKHKPVILMTAADKYQQQKLVQMGADLAIVPHQVGGEYLAHLINKHGIDRKELRKLQV